MEKDDEVKGEGNSYDFGARLFDSRIGRWLAVDPMAGKYAGLSPYNYVANSPIIFVDPNGKWIADIKKGEDNNYYIVFIAEKGDNLSTLEIQMGLAPGSLEAHVTEKTIKKVKRGQELKLSTLETVQNINSYLNSTELRNDRSGGDERLSDEGCVNCSQLVDAISNGKTPTGSYTRHFAEFTKTFEDKYINVTADKAQTGDVITYVSTENSFRHYLSYFDKFTNSKVVNDLYNESDKTISKVSFAIGLLEDDLVKAMDEVRPYVENDEIITQLAKKNGNEAVIKFMETFGATFDEERLMKTMHYSILLLKTRDGKGVQQILEDDGSKFNYQVSDYPTKATEFEPSPSPIHRKKEQ